MESAFIDVNGPFALINHSRQNLSEFFPLFIEAWSVSDCNSVQPLSRLILDRIADIEVPQRIIGNAEAELTVTEHRSFFEAIGGPPLKSIWM